jgi:peptide deformylase
MKIVTYPNFNLRQKSTAITKVNKKLVKLLKELEQTLAQKNIGVGLAAPQLGFNVRLFGTYISEGQTSENQELTEQASPPVFRAFINPKIIRQAKQLTLGPKKQREFEGCLSVPKIYAPVWRPEWLELSYDELIANELQPKKIRLEGFLARIVAHEYDHLEGVLFVDHVLAQGTPLYLENDQGELDEIDRSELERRFGSWS